MKEIELPKVTDDRGNLSFFESERSIPFKIKGVRLLNIYNTDDQYKLRIIRVLVSFFALSGSFLFKNSNADNFINGIFLQNANKGVYIAKNTDFILSGFAENTVVLIISSTEEFNVRKI
ncbi:WxcM-like domain-containing protein [Treponema sp. OMZ 792]|uniref:WxcM-like domain-containing protein n=1 Tax=Treponema sp. OMZ 792 TaxID=2563667 RepID=UPI0020A2FE17|nr:WxcM-like domain-containing protein [Treponema sp. OMZ 792]UTC76301.1 WxcM-like domain-containing protein [Treponema sp. OMZ 792]